MTLEQSAVKTPECPCVDRWRVVKSTYKHANSLSCYVITALVRLFVVMYFIFCLLVLVLRYAILPNIGVYKANFEHLLSTSLGRSVSIASIDASWHGLNPYLELQQVRIRDEHGMVALQLPRVNATLSWWSLPTLGLRLNNLEIIRPELDIHRAPDGKIAVAGWWLDPTQKGGASGADWLLLQREIKVTNGVVHWNDQLRNAPPLVLNGVSLVLQNHWRHHKFALSVTPPASLAGPLEIRADFTHPVFSHSVSDYSQWSGELYAYFSRTDLSGWKNYVDYPVEVQQGMGAVRAWFHFDRARAVDFTADLHLENVKTRLRNDLQMLDLSTVSGRISAQELGTAPHSAASGFGAYGHQLSLINFTFETNDGLHLPKTNFTEIYTPANRHQAEQLTVNGQFIDLQVLANLMVHVPLPLEYRKMLQEFAPEGQLSDFSVKLQGKYPELTHYNVDGKFSNLSMKPQAARQAQNGAVALPALPGFANLTGNIDANEAQGKVELNSTYLNVELPSYFSESPMRFERLSMQAEWAMKADNQVLLKLDKLDFTQQGMHANFSGTHLIPINPDKHKPLGILDLSGTISHFDIQKLDQYLPTVTPADLRYWLTKGLESGHVDDISVRIRGNLADFPFVKKGVFDQNIFNVTGKIVDGQINYTPGLMAKDGLLPFWPILKKIQGKIEFDRDSMDINATSAETEGIAIGKTHVRIAQLISTDPWLDIDGSAVASLQSMLGYVSVSPVIDMIEHFTDETKALGKAKLTLKLHLPLAHIIDAKVQGGLQLADNDVVLQRDLPLFSGMSGRLEFNERGVTIPGLNAQFLGGPVSVTGGSLRDGSIRIKAEGTMTAAGLRTTYPQPELRHLLERLDGGTPYTALIQVKNAQTEMSVDSTLQGLSLHLPAPLDKIAASSLPLHFDIKNLSVVGPIGVFQDELKLSIGAVANARYLRQKNSSTADWRVVRGGIGVNVPAPSPESGVALQLDVALLNVDELSHLLSTDTTATATATAATAKVLLQNNLSSDFNLSQYIQPDTIGARASELTLVGKKLNHVVVGASRQYSSWQANVDSKEISGYVTWDNADHGLGHIRARLSSLVIPQSAEGDVAQLLQDKDLHSDIPGLDIIAEHVELFGTSLGMLELQAKNVSNKKTGNQNEWEVNKLTLTNPDSQLTANGKWSSQYGINATEFNYELQLVNAGKFLERFGYMHVLSGGKGMLSGTLHWTGLPYSLDIPSLTGQIQLDMQSGQFLKVEPGVAKLFAVLNLQALPRRLALDFRDVFSEGFAFDGITATAQIANGVAKTDNFKMRSVNATVLLSGTADIQAETQNLRVVVIPEINAGAASVVYALAVNPVIGLGTFLAQLFLRQPLMKAFTFEYQITGPWKEPTAVKLDPKTELKFQSH